VNVSWIPTSVAARRARPGEPAVAILYFLQLVVNGLTYGSVIALVAIGYTLIYGVIGVVNLAFGDIYMVGAFVATAVMLALAAAGIGSYGLGAVLALPVAMASPPATASPPTGSSSASCAGRRRRCRWSPRSASRWCCRTTCS